MGEDRALEEWSTRFGLLEDGNIEPVIAAGLPILEAARANELLVNGTADGTVVLLAPDLL